MPPTEVAQKKHDELFPGHISTLKKTDPELIEVFDNFAFEEVLRTSNLDDKTRLMVQLAGLIACQALGEYRVMLGAALTVGVSRVEIKEIVYQAVPYVGMGRSSTSSTPPMTSSWSAASNCRSKANQRLLPSHVRS